VLIRSNLLVGIAVSFEPNIDHIGSTLSFATKQGGLFFNRPGGGMALGAGRACHQEPNKVPNKLDPNQSFCRNRRGLMVVSSWENCHEKIGFDWRDCHRRGGHFRLPNFGQVVGRKEFVRESGQGCRRNWKTCHARKRRRCRTESRQTSGAALRGGRDLPALGT
jgi:hypothetical protein